MINKIIAIFKGKFLNAKSATYEELFEVAKTFTKGKSYSLDSPTKSSSSETSVSTLLKELSDLLGKYQSNYNHPDYTPVYLFGGDCANIHINILNYIQKYYSDISANITIGGVLLSGQQGFQFSQDKCNEWLENGSPEIFSCHAWITIDNDYILDCTIGTYINTRIDPAKDDNISQNAYGGLTFGKVDNLQHIAISNLKGKRPPEDIKIEYNPVILGEEAFEVIVPKST
ncbi:Uncharacterised protein [Buttiauxella agrestis]|uniref:Uncharacterized protein n=1 Tax=Buttiauxella agrestis TaxID=82977 RepID=A0A381KNA3_9ENTR|nr:hypothetical protein [Buttiauxella agrestis]SUY92833.1 Uncharacterised protein [Buttiauxella agrestis]